MASKRSLGALEGSFASLKTPERFQKFTKSENQIIITFQISNFPRTSIYERVLKRRIF